MSFPVFQRLLLSLMLAFCSTAKGDDSSDAVGVLQQFLASEYLAEKEDVLGMVGFYGAPKPPQWLILSSIKREKEILRESVFARGEVVAERKFRKLPGQDLPSIPIAVETIKFSSGEAFRKVEKMAIKRKVAFDSVHYQLRCRELENEPVWMLSLISPAQVTIGVVYISASSGEVLRESWPHLPVEKVAPPLTQASSLKQKGP